jgi:PIN domain
MSFSIDPPLRWRPNAAALIGLMRMVQTDVHSGVDLGVGLLRVTDAAGPDHPLLVQALRHPDVWPARATSAFAAPAGRDGFHNVVQGLPTQAEDIARQAGARSVGERHIVSVLQRSGLNQWGIHTANLIEAIHVLELGPQFDPQLLGGRWHGFVDANIVLHFNDLHQVDWSKEVGQKAITLWVAGTLLNELDDLQHSSRSRGVRNRAKRFGAWLHPLMEVAMSADGTEIRPGVVLRVWAPATSGLRDTDHLEAALELVERGVPLVVITQDMGMRARALGQGLVVHRMSDRYKLPDEPTLAEETEKLRRAAEGIAAPPALSLTTDRAVTGTVLLYVACAPDRGEAKSTTVLWYPNGGFQVDVRDARAEHAGQLVQGPDGWIRQQLTAHLAPGTSDLIAEMTFGQAPGSIVYELRAEGTEVQRDELWWNGQTYAPDDSKTPTEDA